MIFGIQIVGVFFGLFMIYLTFLYHKRREFTSNERIFWFVMASGFILLSLFPNFLDPITESLNVVRTMDLLIIFGFMFLIGITFYMYNILRKTQKKLEKVVRVVAIKKVNKK